MSKDWIAIGIEMPNDEEAQKLLDYLYTQHGFTKMTDWCEHEREDFALLTYGPCTPITSSRYAVEPHKRNVIQISEKDADFLESHEPAPLVKMVDVTIDEES